MDSRLDDGRLIGAPMRRREDPRLVRGRGQYAGDLQLSNMVYAAFVRSPHAHARVTSVALDKARAMPGGVAAYGPAELPLLGRPLAQPMPFPFVKAHMPSPLAADVVRYVGEPVAVVVAESRAQAVDMAEAVEVDYEPLPAVAGVEAAQASGAPRIHDDVPGNLAARFGRAIGDVEKAFADAEVVVRGTFHTARAAGAAIEPRAVAAAPADDGEAVTVWVSTQAPHAVRGGIARALDLPREQVHVVTPDVGGGFGPKGRLYSEEIVLAAVARELGRPVSWVATRQEDLLTTYLGRGLVAHAELAARADGSLLGLRAQLVQDGGAYLPTSLIVSMSSAQHLLGPYRWPAFGVEIVGVYTNSAPLSPLRGGGRELGIFVVERMMDLLARRLGRDPVELRTQNALRPGDFPYDTHYPQRGGDGTVVYDSGNFPAYLDRARELIGYDAIRASQAEEHRSGRYRGVAITAFIESTGMGEESARVEVREDGGVDLVVGSPSNGQSHATTLAQMCAERLGARFEDVRYVSGDTRAMPQGVGTFGSRIATIAGNAVAQAATATRERVLDVASRQLEVAAEDLEAGGGEVWVRGAPRRRLTFAEIARAAGSADGKPALTAERSFSMPQISSYAGGAHAAVVEVDPETGLVQIERYVVVHDCGTVINPLVVDGQVEGGVIHGLGNALLEGMQYDDQGQVLTASWQDYAMPAAGEHERNRYRTVVPEVEVEHMASPSPYNPEGIKGAGEGGTIGSLATLVGAVEDALAPFGVELRDIPLRPEALRAAIQAH